MAKAIGDLGDGHTVGDRLLGDAFANVFDEGNVVDAVARRRIARVYTGPHPTSKGHA